MVASSFSVQLPFLDIFSLQDLVPYTPSNYELTNICGITPFFRDEVTVWGQCGEDVVINFETEDGITGTSVGTVVCV